MADLRAKLDALADLRFYAELDNLYPDHNPLLAYCVGLHEALVALVETEAAAQAVAGEGSEKSG